MKETFELRASEPYRERCGVRVEDIETEFLQSLFKHHVHHGVVFTILCVQITDLYKETTKITEIAKLNEG